MKTVLHIENLDCPVCAEVLQGDIKKLKGVTAVTVDYVSQTIALETEDELAVARVVKTANNFEEVKVLDGGRYALKRNFHVKEWLFILFSTLFLVAALSVIHFLKGKSWEIVGYCLFAVAYFLVGYPVLISTVKNIVKGRIFDENFLMTVASVGAVFLGEFGEAVLVMLLYQLGELLQSIAVGSSRQSVTKLMDLKSEWATVVLNGEQKQVKPEELCIGDIVLIKAGEKVPVDGILLSENALLDTKSLTGEPQAKQIKKDEEMLSGTINEGGMVEMKVVRTYQDSAVGKILDMVENAAAGKAKPEKFITKFAKYYTPIVCCLALAIAVFAPLVSGLISDNRLYFKGYDRWLQSALTFLVVSCPCALIISVPLTYFSGIGMCAKNGVLVKGATYLDVAAKAKIIAFDKTGTLTEGNFVICNVQPQNTISENELLGIATAVERGSAHPIAGAFNEIKTDFVAEDVTEESGKGLIASIDGEIVLVGNKKLLTEHGFTVEERQSIYTQVYVTKGNVLLGVIEIGDKLREEAKETVFALKKLGVTKCVMLTGDSNVRAQKVAKEIGMYEVNAELLPLEKQKKADELKKQGGLIYVGDGINDAPVMAVADCSVSMGTLGSAAAVEASDMVLISDNLKALPKAISVARKTRKIVFQNIIFSIAMKVAFMVLGACGILPLWLAVFADVGVMLLAVLNSFRVRFLK